MSARATLGPYRQPVSAEADDPEFEARTLYQLVYFSQSLIQPLAAGGDRAIADILAVARKTNLTLGVTGALAFNEFHFAQVLEGARRDVETLFDRIREDPRHRNVQVAEERWIASRDFAAWAMAYVGDGDRVLTISPGRKLTDIMEGAEGRGLVEMLKFFLCDGSRS